MTRICNRRTARWCGLLCATLAVSALPARAAALARPAGTTSSPPTAHINAFRGQGDLAFAWGDRLYVLDGAHGTVRAVGHPGTLDALSWSPDGRWLAFIVRAPGVSGSGALWMARADGGDTHQVTGLPTAVSSVSWSPVTDTLAVALDVAAKQAPGLWLTTPTGHPHRLVVGGPAMLSRNGGWWSPDGATLAFDAPGAVRAGAGRGDALYTVPASGGRPIHRATTSGGGMILAGWWPAGKGLLYWLDPMYSSSIAADGMQLLSVPLGNTPRLLTRTLAAPWQLTLGYPGWHSWSPDGRQVALVVGGGRQVWAGKALATCDVQATTCSLWPKRRGTVAMEPAWSPDGNHIAFVRARDAGAVGGFGSEKGFRAWIHTRTLWVEDAHGNGAHEIAAAGGGIYQPRWSADSRHILYIRKNSLWLVDVNGGAAAQIVGPLPRSPTLYPYGYYGFLSWSGTVAWHQ